MKREFLTQFLNGVLNFPRWVKDILYNELSKEISDNVSAYLFTSYKPVLTYKGRCEHDSNNIFDSNISNLLDCAYNNLSISQITLNTYLSLEEVAKYFIFCIEQEYFETPENLDILSVAGFLAGKYRTGEYFVKTGKISDEQLSDALENQKNNSENKKLGQILTECGMLDKHQIDMILEIKQDAQKRFVLDYNEVPKVNSEDMSRSELLEKQIERLKNENKILKTKLEQLLTMVK